LASLASSGEEQSARRGTIAWCPPLLKAGNREEALIRFTEAIDPLMDL
jgi:hypothetical protein